MKRLILPGWHGSGPGHWQRRWAETDPDASIVEQADWAYPDLEAWLGRLRSAVTAADAPVLLIAHSLGVILAAHYVARFSGGGIAAALLVAPGDVDVLAATEPDIAGFAPLPRARLPFPSVLVASRNDPHIEYHRAVAMAADFGARLFDIGEAGHVNLASGYGEWPIGFDLARELEGAARVPEIVN